MTEMKEAKRGTVKCLGCGRRLKAKASVAQQRGPKCQARHQREVQTALNLLEIDLHANFSDEQIMKAADLIVENGIVERLARPTGRHIYLAISSDGQERYTTEVDRCTCKAGQYGRRCYHRAAALVLDTVASVAA